LNFISLTASACFLLLANDEFQFFCQIDKSSFYPGRTDFERRKVGLRDLTASRMPVPNCVVCDKLSTFACVDCKTSHYCSINCINKDLPVHQLFCHPLVKFLASTPKPASKSIRYDTASDGEKGVIYRRGLLFPVDSKVPQYIWVKFTQTFNAGQGSIYEEADLLEWLGDRIAAHLTNENLGRATMLHSVQLSHRSDFLFDGSSSNKCIEALSSHGRKRSEWRGPVIALHSPVDGDGEGPQAEDSLEYEDITPEDGRVALNVFVYNTRKAEKDLADCFNKMSVCTASFPETLKGVMISCNGDQHFLRKNKVYKTEGPLLFLPLQFLVSDAAIIEPSPYSSIH